MLLHLFIQAAFHVQEQWFRILKGHKIYFDEKYQNLNLF